MWVRIPALSIKPRSLLLVLDIQETIKEKDDTIPYSIHLSRTMLMILLFSSSFLLLRSSSAISHLSFSLLSLPPLLLSFLIITFYILFDRPWPLSNLLALSLAHNAISLISLDSFVTGSILLGGLFLYDIFWVFGTDVMVSVARQFEAPVKIVSTNRFTQFLPFLLLVYSFVFAKFSWMSLLSETNKNPIHSLLSFILGLSKELRICHHCLSSRRKFNSKMAAHFTRSRRYSHSR